MTEEVDFRQEFRIQTGVGGVHELHLIVGASGVGVEGCGHSLSGLGHQPPRGGDNEVGRVPEGEHHPTSAAVAAVTNPGLGNGTDHNLESEGHQHEGGEIAPEVPEPVGKGEKRPGDVAREFIEVDRC